MARVDLHAKAALEAEASALWYEQQSPGLGEEFLGELASAIRAIRESPDRWFRTSGGERRYLLHRFPFAVIYRHRSGDIFILAIAHVRRRPGYWKDRVRD